MKILDFNQLRVSSEMTAYQVIKSRPLFEINSENEGKTLFRVVISRGITYLFNSSTSCR